MSVAQISLLYTRDRQTDSLYLENVRSCRPLGSPGYQRGPGWPFGPILVSADHLEGTAPPAQSVGQPPAPAKAPPDTFPSSTAARSWSA